MGATFNYVYVKFPDAEAVESQLVRLAEDPRHADSISITDTEEERGGWSLVLDGGPPGSQVISRELSRNLDCVTMSLWVYDSDVWGYLLFDRGELIDEHVSDPEYVAGMDGSDPSQVPTGKPEALAPYVSGGLASMRQLLDDRPEFAEDVVERLTELLLDGPNAD